MIHQFDDTHHLRAAPRFKLFQPAEITTSGRTSRVHLLNLSAGGALIHAAVPPSRGTPVHVRCGGHSRAARVAWVHERRFGVAFANPLATDQVAQVIADQEALVAAASRRIGAVMPSR